MSTQKSETFEGFEQPKNNYYRLPNSWFDLCAWMNAQRNASRMDGTIKWLEYLIKHSWGYLNFDTPVRLTTDEFANGRRRATKDRSRGGRMDLGTGLSSRALIEIPKRLLDLGLIERRKDDSDKARVKYHYLPRVREEEAPPTARQTLDTFEGFDVPHSNYFPVPFEWTNLIRDISSGVAILSGEYLMRHTFGWRDPVRWLTPTEIATGRQKQDGSTYDQGIHYPRGTVASACDLMVEEGLFVWRPARRDIGREKREYALRMQRMVVDEETGCFIGWEGEQEEQEQSKPLTRQSTPPTSQSTDHFIEQNTPLTRQSTPLTRQSKALTPQSKPLIQQSKPLTRLSSPRTDNNTLRQNSTEHSDRTHTTKTSPSPPRARAHDADAAPLQQALSSLGINGQKRDEILALDDPSILEAVHGWAYWAYAQDWADQPSGLVIKRVLNPETRHALLPPFDRFGREHGSPLLTACALVEAYRLAGYAPSSLGQQDLVDQWSRHFGRRRPEDLPPTSPAADLWASESRRLQVGIEQPADDGIKHRWDSAWTALSAEDGELDPVGQPLGTSDGALVVFVEDPVARVEAEGFRDALEAQLGTAIQFTAVKPRIEGSRERENGRSSRAARSWQKVARQLEHQMTRATYAQHFARCIALSLEHGRLDVQVESAASLAWIEHRLRPMIVRAVKQATEDDVSRLRLIAPRGEEIVIEIGPRDERVDQDKSFIQEGDNDGDEQKRRKWTAETRATDGEGAPGQTGDGTPALSLRPGSDRGPGAGAEREPLHPGVYASAARTGDSGSARGVA